MKGSFAGVLILLSLLAIQSCSVSNRINSLTGKSVLDNKMPPELSEHHFVRINDTLYASAFELTNVEYKRFLSHITATQPEKFNDYKPDSTLWLKYPSGSIPSQHYFVEPRFDSYPVCCISWEAANDYCRWLSREVNADLRTYQVTFRLPMENEWKLLAPSPDEGGLDLPYPLGFESASNCYWLNFSHTDSITGLAEDGGYYSVWVNAYVSNSINIYNAHGNVAEMTSLKGLCKGGGWNDSLSNCSVHARNFYPVPSAEVGFRLFFVVSKK